MSNDLISRSELLERSMPAREFARNCPDLHVVSVNSVRRAPAVDAEPVRYGRWYKPIGMMMPPEHHGRHRCTVCDHMALYFRIGYEELSPYCPNCGAKMDLEEDE